MAEVAVEPVFKTPRQRVVRDVLTAVVGCAVLWFLFLGEPPAQLDAVLLLGGGVVAVLFVVARARSIFPPWPDRRFWNLLVNAVIVLASVLLLPYVPNEIAWAGVGFTVAGLAARLVLYATGEWRPGEPPEP